MAGRNALILGSTIGPAILHARGADRLARGAAALAVRVGRAARAGVDSATVIVVGLHDDATVGRRDATGGDEDAEHMATNAVGEIHAPVLG